MGFTISYNYLFELKVIHHFFLDKSSQLFDNLTSNEQNNYLKYYNIENLLDIRPTDFSQQLLRNHQCIFKKTQSGIIVGTKTKKLSGKIHPSVQFNDNLHLTFLFSLRDDTFYNYTSLPLKKTKGQTFYFTNETANAPKTYPYLSKFAPVYKAGSKYSSGDVLVNHASTPTQAYIAKQATNNSPPSAEWTNDPFVSGKPLHYVNENDLIPIYNNVLSYDSGQSGLDLTITLKNSLNEALEPRIEKMEKTNSCVDIFLHDLPEGKYHVKIEDTTIPYLEEFYFFHVQEPTDSIFGVLDLVIKSKNSNYNLLNTDGSLKNPVLELRFKNRHTLWRFLGNNFNTKPETGPHPLTKYGYINVSVPDDSSTIVDELPNPDTNMVKTEFPLSFKENYNVVSEVYINTNN